MSFDGGEIWFDVYQKLELRASWCHDAMIVY